MHIPIPLKGLGFEKLHDEARCQTIVVSFHYNIRHFHIEEAHCQGALQQCRLNVPNNASLTVYQAVVVGH